MFAGSMSEKTKGQLDDPIWSIGGTVVEGTISASIRRVFVIVVVVVELPLLL